MPQALPRQQQRTRSVDPTHTLELRRKFRNVATFNLNRLRAQLRQAVVEFNILGLSGSEQNPYRSRADSIRQFSGWLETAANANLDARWWATPYLDQAIGSGVRAAVSEIGQARMPVPPSFAELHELAGHELRGIIAAMLQKLVRVADRSIAMQASPAKALHALTQPIEHEIKPRLQAFSNTFVVKAHNKGKIETYRASGIRKVGLDAELRGKLRCDAVNFNDDDGDMVGWLTAGDDDVCEDCEDYAEASPYTLDEADALMPVHPNCRCSVFPWDDGRYAGDSWHDEDVGHPFRGNQYAEGESGGGKAKVKAASSYEFVSPSVAAHLDFGQAAAALNGSQQHALREASGAVNQALGISASSHDIIGAWADGAENSMMDQVDHADWDKLKLSAAMKGYLADQKQVLVFHEDAAGEAVMAHFEAKGSLADIHRQLLQDGVAFHTLVPHAGGATVYVADLDGSQLDNIKKAAQHYDAEVGIKFGRAEFIGTQKQDGSDREQRDDARKIYQGIIEQSPVEGHDKIWAGIRDRWGQAIHPEVAAVPESWNRVSSGAVGEGSFVSSSGERAMIVTSENLAPSERMEMSSDIAAMQSRAEQIESETKDPQDVQEYGAINMITGAASTMMERNSKQVAQAWAFDNNYHLVGGVAVRQGETPGTAEIAFLGTTKQGLGEHLLAAGEDIARSRFGAKSIELTALPTVSGFYQRHGYMLSPDSDEYDLKFTKTL